MIKTIGKKSEKIGDTIVTGEGADVKVVNKTDDSVAVRDYVAGKGYSGIVNWDGENPTIAGVKVKPTEIKNGIAYVKREDVDSILGEMENNTGIKGAQKARDEKYGKLETDALNAVVNRKPFSYDVGNDVVYQAYKKQYEREAEHALRRILNENNTSVTGASGAVLSEAMSAYDAELDKITDMIPELYEDAYNRYIKEGEMLNSTLKTINDIADSYFDNVYNSDTDIKESIIKAGEVERKERQREIDNQRNATKDMYENALSELDLKYYEDELAADIAKTNASAENTAIDNAIARGFFTESDEAAIPWLKNYRTANGGYSISPAVASVAYEYDAARARERGKINAKLGL